MSGTTKKYLAILGTVGVAVTMTVMQALPGNPKVHLGCEIVLAALGALGFTFPVSIKAPDQPGTLQPPAGK